MFNPLKRRAFLQLMGALPALRTAGLPAQWTSLYPAGSDGDKRKRNWWEAAGATIPLFIRERKPKNAVLPLTPLGEAAKRLDEMRSAGITGIEIYAPAEGGNSFLGLDTINRYRLEPRSGATLDDFRRLVDLVHDKGMRIISIDNLGYCSVEAVDFLKACADVKAGRDSREARFFVWSNTADAPPPGSGGKDRYFMVRPKHLPTYPEASTIKNEFWQYSERAGKYYWTKWEGVDLAGKRVRLPQYNWGSPEFQEEAAKIVRFWMDTGIDGMLIDAVNWYVDCNWRLNRQCMTNIIGNNKFSQPEGAGAFRDDPAAWITEGGWTCVQDYGLGIFWEKGTNVVTNAIESGDPRPIEPALRNYHDRVVEAGGTLYFNPPKFEDPRKSRLAMALAAATGELICLAGVVDGLWTSIHPDAEESKILQWKAAHPALHTLSRRQALPVPAADKHYAVVRTARDGSERMIVVMNFQPQEQTVGVNLSGVDFEEMTDPENSSRVARQLEWQVTLPGYGYRFCRLNR